MSMRRLNAPGLVLRTCIILFLFRPPLVHAQNRGRVVSFAFSHAHSIVWCGVFQIELEQAASLHRESMKALDKSQSAELKYQPKEIKSAEQKIKKEYNGTLKVTERKFRSSFRQLKSTRENSVTALKEYEEEKSSTMAKLESQYRTNVDEMKRGRTASMTKKHTEAHQRLEETNSTTLQELKSYQAARQESHDQQLAQATQMLKNLLKSKSRDLKNELGMSWRCCWTGNCCRCVDVALMCDRMCPVGRCAVRTPSTELDCVVWR